ncbi:amino acid ABC transporter [Phyllobacterium salinisoli]|uniref:Amino acid ABC transporter n=1 Tax=Phyllobacterium salinisoli TaxID=1899321 RepID=A0A368K5N8_9HYPH|nr:transporter substrate-binding domain-containing protein [Phyllobacterium salinisoli]RCS24689.1 amino acid ABC transporter [Phyllobacterium salinisoli]
MRFPVSASSLILSACLALGVSASPAAAKQPDVPAFWDPHERIAKPDLSKLRRLRFLTSVDFPPFNFVDSGGRLAGYNIDLARAICTELAIIDICQIEAIPWNELRGRLEAGEGEAIIAGLEPTAENRAEFAFSRPYLRLPARFVTQRTAVLNEPLDRNLRGKRVGVIAGTTHETMLRRYFPQTGIVGYTLRDQLLSDLKAGKLDAVFGDGMTLSFWLDGKASEGCCAFSGGPYLGPQFLGEGMTIAASTGNVQLSTAFDHALKALEEKGVLAELYLKYFPVSFY